MLGTRQSASELLPDARITEIASAIAHRVKPTALARHALKKIEILQAISTRLLASEQLIF